MYAIVEACGRQYRCEPGVLLDVDLMPDVTGESVELDRVLLIAGDGEPVVGKPHVAGAKVVADVVGEVKGDKIIVFKYKAKARYRRKTGHRQRYLRLRVTDIVTEQSGRRSGQQPDTTSASTESSREASPAESE
ncbi:MAG: 50S ribosomal protein L21 [Chloroflexi bacterium]|nr:50S ribosomal protein L21 [Chloroflexota bacterium]